MTPPVSPILKDHKSRVVGIANEHSIAYGCAAAFRDAGAELAVTWLNDKARPHVEPLAEQLGADITAPLNVENPGELEQLFELIATRWGKLDSVIHSIAFAPKEDLQGGLLNCSAAGFARAIDVSCHSFIRMAKLAAPLMPDGGTMFAMSYLGANRVVCTVDHHANTSAASIPLALAEAAGDGRLQEGQLVLLEAVGGGLAWGASVIRW